MKNLLWIVPAAAIAAGGAWLWLRPSADGPYAAVAREVNRRASSDCDTSSRADRLALSQVIDKLRPRIQRLRQALGPKDFPEFKMQAVGPVFLRLSREKRIPGGYDDTVWSWWESRGVYLRTQSEPGSPENSRRWRDLDTGVRYLLQHDLMRILRGKSYPVPEKTEHFFRPLPAVSRSGPRRFELKLDAGDFRGAERDLSSLVERAWRSGGYEVKVRWVTGDPDAYRLRANFTSGRSYVNHREKVMVIENYTFTRTVAHELGHLLGFDDHYYSVWNERNCYYTQKSRLADLMSNSASGRVLPDHWRVLDQAYPWKRPARTEVFGYFFHD